ncbi:polysaccharide lyase 6 family protein [Streptomyces sp. ISL-36]|uniref:polysaccharide lyase 6 family protein n=1 Tax=Streptomyces sp. ISL-36 TaxID=2819182 RepID=UPI001BEBAF90|nr:polysaccharide lyase 6 family protein [Streptomyces sp. ISL-36]MBT2444462.1 polysaccharide lyase 6 family protein [Streptomyces sp. ISL-36]
MQRRTFLTGTAAGAFVAALPLSGPAHANTVGDTSAHHPGRRTLDVGSLDELQKAIDTATPGTRIVVADGEYTVPSAKPLSVRGRHGSRSEPVTIAARSRGGVVLHGEHSFVFDDSSSITVSGFSFRQSTTLEIPANCSHIRLSRNDFRLADIEGLHWVMVRGDDTEIDHNHFHGKTTLGIYLGIEGAGSEAMAQRVHVHRNHFSDHTFAGANGGEPIRLGVSGRALTSAHAVVEYNLFERADGDPEAISVKSSDNIIRHNTIRNSLGGIVLRHGNGTLVDGNYLIGGKEGLRIYGNDHVVVNNYLAGLSGRAMVIGSGTARDHVPGESSSDRRGNDAPDRVLIAHNTLLGNAGTLSGESHRPHEPRDVTIADNLLVGDAGDLVEMANMVRFTWQGNILFGAAGDGDIPAGGFQRADPRLVRGADGVYRLSRTSRAIGAATLRQPPVTHDIDGDPRGRLRDVGADEYATRAPRRRPLTPADVGPHAR